MRIFPHSKTLNRRIQARRMSGVLVVGEVALRQAMSPIGEMLSTLPWLEGLMLVAFLMLALG